SRLAARRLRADSRLTMRTRGQMPRSAQASASGTVYEGGAHTRRTLGWNAPTTTPNSGILGSLTTLRDRSRAAVRNDGFAKNAIDELVSSIIGTGIEPLSQAEDPDFRKGLMRL